MAKPVFIIGERAGVWTYGDDGELRLATEDEEAAAMSIQHVSEHGGPEVSQAKPSSYTIAVQDTIAELVEAVNDLTAEGWQPIGAPFYVQKAFDARGWHQALFYDATMEGL